MGEVIAIIVAIGLALVIGLILYPIRARQQRLAPRPDVSITTPPAPADPPDKTVIKRVPPPPPPPPVLRKKIPAAKTR